MSAVLKDVRNKEMDKPSKEVVQPTIPVSVDLWDLRSIGAYLKRSPEVVREKYACLPSFPRPVRLPSVGSGRSHALYKAREIIAWAESFAS